jgi:hypothetical protein
MSDVIDQVRCTGYDKNGIARVFGTGSSHDIAETRCYEAVRDYVKRRPDTGPLSGWSFTFNRSRNSLT